MKEMYTSGEYLEHNPTWHAEDATWKARTILKMIDKHKLLINSVGEIGCGTGEILRELARSFPSETRFTGYEISPQAIALTKKQTDETSAKLRPFVSRAPVDPTLRRRPTFRGARQPVQRKSITFSDVSDTRVEMRQEDLLQDDTTFFDLLLCIDVFEHVEDYLGFLRQVRKKGEHKIFHIPLDLSVQSLLRVSPILKQRMQVGHLHYFTKETALATLKDSGYEIIDCVYTGSSIDLPHKSPKSLLMRLPRKIAFCLNQDLAVRVLGGYSLLVLTR